MLNVGRGVRLAGLAVFLVIAFAWASSAEVAARIPQRVTPTTTPTPTTDRRATPPREAATLIVTSSRVLASGAFDLPAATAFGAPGFHEVLSATHLTPSDLGPTTGQRLVMKLWDAGRPTTTCSSEHPLSGCATVDWSDATSRPKVPAGGVFVNSLTLQLVSGVRAFFLSESGSLNDKPDSYNPG